MRLLVVLEFVFVIFLCWAFVTQMLLPTLRSEPWWPWFNRRRRKLEEAQLAATALENDLRIQGTVEEVLARLNKEEANNG